VAEEHALLEAKAGRVYCSVLYPPESDDLFSPTGVWLDDTELRAGVAYLVAPGSKLAFGTSDNVYIAEFEEQGGAGGMSAMLMQGLAGSAAPEVKEMLDGLQ
jgi:hypothetical protein